MKNTIKKVLCSLLVVVMCLSIVPLQGFDLLGLGVTASALSDSGTCGDNLTWTLENEILTISGTGEMYDYKFGESPFSYYKNSVMTIIIEDGVTSIGDYAFLSCVVDRVLMPKSVISIGVSAFAGTYLYKGQYDYGYVYYEGTKEDWNAIEIENYSDSDLSRAYIIYEATNTISSGKCGENTTYTCDELGTLIISGTGEITSEPWSTSARTVIIEEGVTAISFGKSFGSSLRSIHLPDSLKTIGNRTFEGCYDLSIINLPEGLTTIGDYAFASCISLIRIVIPASVTSIGYGAFQGSSAGIIVDKNNPSYHSENGILFNNDKTELIYCGNNFSIFTTKAYTVPDGVTTIADRAFYDCHYLSEITLPESVTSIGEAALRGTVYYKGTTDISIVKSGVCGDNLTWTLDNVGTLTVSGTGEMWHRYEAKDNFWPADSSIKRAVIKEGVTSIGVNAFNSCEYLMEVELPDTLTSIHSGAFYYCQSLATVDIPDRVTTLGSAFTYCATLDNIVIPKGVTKIYTDTFFCCMSLTNLELHDDITEIGTTAFGYCALTEVTIPRSAKMIDQAFSWCSSLKKVTIYDNLSYIETYAFTECYNLTDVYYDGTEEQWNEINIDIGNAYLTGADIRFEYCCVRKDSGHSYKRSVVVAPTCTEKGYTSNYCECGYIYKNNFTDKIPHTYTSEITTLPTHLKEGVKTFTCECGDTYKESVAKLEGHTYTSAITTQPTHITEGIETFTCACGDSYTEPVAKLEEHSYEGAITTQPTHKEEGVKTFTCECGDFYTEPVAVIPHSHEAVVTAPTCTEDGYTTYTCECGDSYVDDYKDAKGHSHTGRVTTPATHTASGVMTYTCICKDSYTEIIPKLSDDHKYNGEITTPATHLKEGVKTYTCECGDTYTVPVPKLSGHTYSEKVTAPTCTANGYTTFTCECGYSYVGNYVNVIEHKYSSKVTVTPTHTKTGVLTYICSACGNRYTEDIAKLPDHTYTVKGVTAPTCTAQGYTSFVCACGDTYNSDYVPATGHSDNNSDGICDSCGKNLNTNPNTCSHTCHKGGFMGFIWKILCFFYKIVGSNKICSCGVAHY